MGKGDKKSRKGKLFMGSYGVSRPRKKTKAYIPVRKPAPVAKPVAEAITSEAVETTPKKAVRKKAASDKPKKPAAAKKKSKE